jgi:hypothetical protein
LFHVRQGGADNALMGALSITGGIVKRVLLTSVGDFYDGDETTATKPMTAKNGERT